VATDQDQKYVWVVQPDGGVDYRKITLGSQFGSFRVVSQGLAPSDNVVVDGIAKLRPGVKVKPEPTTVPYDG
jgi:multidrug efflux pump subunit AcrA (membrane-fusion protein)